MNILQYSSLKNCLKQLEYLLKHKLFRNTSMLYLLNAAKMFFPLFTFPYLTRVLSIDAYAALVYTKAVMRYMQMWVDFGFLLSATKRIVKANKDYELMSHIVSDTIFARLLLAIIGAIGLLILGLFVPLLKQNLLFVWLSYIAVFLSCFMTDYLFRGIEKMHEITIRFVTMKSISTVLTFVFVHSDQDLIKIPILDILSSLVALVLISAQLKKYSIHLLIPSCKKALLYIRESFEYFLSSVSTTAFGVLNTVLIGIFLPEADVAIWAVALQLISFCQSCYNPIISAIYPEMIRNKKFALIKKLLLILMPLIIVGCFLGFFIAPLIVRVVASEKYVAAIPIFRSLIPVLIFAFPAMMLGWPVLGAIDKVRHTTLTTIISACTQCVGLLILILCGKFTLPSIVFMRNITEGVLLGTRAGFVYKFRKELR